MYKTCFLTGQCKTLDKLNGKTWECQEESGHFSE